MSKRSDDPEKTEKEDTLSVLTDADTPISCLWCKRDSCRRLWHSYNSYWQVGSGFTFIIFYTLLGGLLFNTVERPNEIRVLEEAQQARNKTIQEFIELMLNSTNLTEAEAVNLTNSLIELGRTAAEASDALLLSSNPLWDFSSALFFSTTVITTIGRTTMSIASIINQLVVAYMSKDTSLVSIIILLAF